MADEKALETEKEEMTPYEDTERTSARRAYIPRADIYETDTEIVVAANVSGANENSVDITLEKNVLTIRAYPVEEELTVTLKDGRTVMLRPALSSDAQGIRELFHHLSEADVYTRFFRHVRGLSNAEVQRLCNVNYETEVAFVATTGAREDAQLVAQSCYFVNPTTNLADTAFMVHPQWQGCGLGSAMQESMVRHAKKRGLRGFVTDILPDNTRMLNLARNGPPTVQVEKDHDSVHITQLF